MKKEAFPAMICLIVSMAAQTDGDSEQGGILSCILVGLLSGIGAVVGARIGEYGLWYLFGGGQLFGFLIGMITGAFIGVYAIKRDIEFGLISVGGSALGFFIGFPIVFILRFTGVSIHEAALITIAFVFIGAFLVSYLKARSEMNTKESEHILEETKEKYK